MLVLCSAIHKVRTVVVEQQQQTEGGWGVVSLADGDVSLASFHLIVFPPFFGATEVYER
jgi:hypothetical protein